MTNINSQQLTELASFGRRMNDVCADPAVRKSGRQFGRDTMTALRSGSAFLSEAHSAWRNSASMPAATLKRGRVAR